MSNMKQSTLKFAAAKRTASNAGKSKVVSSNAVPLPKTSRPVTKATSKKKESSEDDIDDYDDVVLKESSGEDIEEAETVKSQPSRDDAIYVSKEEDVSNVEDNETLTQKSRSQTKKSLGTAKSGKEQGSNTSQPFKTSNLKPEDLQKKVEANEVDTGALPELDPTSERWNELHRAAQAQLGGIPSTPLSLIFHPTLTTSQIVHGKDDNKVRQILRVFDK
jgi:hypothetical protein